MKTKLVWRAAGAGMVADEEPDYQGEIRRLKSENAKLREGLTALATSKDKHAVNLRNTAVGVLRSCA